MFGGVRLAGTHAYDRFADRRMCAAPCVAGNGLSDTGVSYGKGNL